MLLLRDTPVSDVGALAGLTSLELLGLDLTEVSDIVPLEKLTALKALWLDGTEVSDLTPLLGLTRLESEPRDAGLNLTPFLALTRLESEPRGAGLTFWRCAATRADARIAEISEIEDASERAGALFAYLREQEAKCVVQPPPEPPAQTPPYIPRPGLAPLQADVIDGRLVRLGRHGLPEQDAMARAEFGWQALKAFRETFGNSCNVHNYSQLMAVLDGFDNAMGVDFDPDSLILIGVMGSAVVALSDDEEFAETLPTGAAALLAQFAMQIEVFVNRFPDWVKYKEEAASSRVEADDVTQEAHAFEGLAQELRDSAETDEAVADDYEMQVVQGTRPDSALSVQTGLVASTREITRVLTEAALDAGKHKLDRMDRVHDDEMAKWSWRLGGFAFVLLSRQSPHLRRLAERFPKQLGWLTRVLDWMGAQKQR